VEEEGGQTARRDAGLWRLAADAGTALRAGREGKRQGKGVRERAVWVSSV